MKMILTILFIFLSLSACGKYESDDPLILEMKARGGQFLHIAERMEAAEKMMVDGQELVLKGREEVVQGRNLVINGETHQKQGNEMQLQGERMKYEAELQYRRLNARRGY